MAQKTQHVLYFEKHGIQRYQIWQSRGAWHMACLDSIAVSVFADIFIELTNTVSDGKIQITILILRRGALSILFWHFLVFKVQPLLLCKCGTLLEWRSKNQRGGYIILLYIIWGGSILVYQSQVRSIKAIDEGDEVTLNYRFFRILGKSRSSPPGTS